MELAFYSDGPYLCGVVGVCFQKLAPLERGRFVLAAAISFLAAPCLLCLGGALKGVIGCVGRQHFLLVADASRGEFDERGTNPTPSPILERLTIDAKSFGGFSLAFERHRRSSIAKSRGTIWDCW